MHYLLAATDGSEWDMVEEACGLPNPSFNTRIVNGDDVDDIRRWPWAGYMTNGYFCGAELISWGWAITAAHCV